ncbi:MAG: GntR family transcriptional regulator [Pseudomonadales bacterium]
MSANMGFEPAVSLTEQIADHIGQQIITGRLEPQQRIQELKIAGDLGVSRGSVREALLILESRHLIEIIPRRGAVVNGLEAGEITNFCELYTDLLTSFFGKLACERGANYSQLRNATEEIGRAVEEQDLETLLGACQAFMDSGFPLVNNFYLASVLRGLNPAGLRLAHMAACHSDYDMRDTLRYHHALLDAIERHDEARVHELVGAYGRRQGHLAIRSLTG